jgi:hypothetical protein
VKPEVAKWDFRLQMERDERFGKESKGKRGVKSMDSSPGGVRIEN